MSAEQCDDEYPPFYSIHSGSERNENIEETTL